MRSSNRFIGAVYPLAFAAGLTACGDGDPVITIVRVFDPQGEVVTSLAAADTGGGPDLLSVTWDAVPEQKVRGFVYEVWLLPQSTSVPFSAGRFDIPRDTTLDLGVQDSELITMASEVQVTLEPDNEDPAARAIRSDELLTHFVKAGGVTLAQIHELLASGTTSGAGSAILLVAQARALRTHAELARDSADAGSIDEARRSLEHVLNIADVPPLDHDGNGVVETPNADQIGLRFLARGVAEVARAAAASTDAWPDAVAHGTQTALAADSVDARVERLIDLARNALAAQDLSALRLLAGATSAFSDTILGDSGAAVAGRCARCGALTAWQQSLLMTTLRAAPQEPFILAPDVTK